MARDGNDSKGVGDDAGRQDLPDHVAEWVAYADRDLAVAQDMARLGHDAWALITCQQAIEKLLKALVAERGEHPPRTHSLPRLASMIGLGLTESQVKLFADLSNAYLMARYPGEVPAEALDPDEMGAEEYLAATEEVCEWLRQQLKSAR